MFANFLFYERMGNHYVLNEYVNWPDKLEYWIYEIIFIRKIRKFQQDLEGLIGFRGHNLNIML